MGWKEETVFSSGLIEKRHSLVPVVSLHPLSRMVLFSLEKTVTALLSNKTVQPLSQSLPIPSRLCLKVGIIRHMGLGRLGVLRSADAEEVWMRPEVSPTLDAGVSGLMLDTGAEGVT